jgi:hypothetical protein
MRIPSLIILDSKASIILYPVGLIYLFILLSCCLQQQWYNWARIGIRPLNSRKINPLISLLPLFTPWRKNCMTLECPQRVSEFRVTREYPKYPKFGSGPDGFGPYNDQVFQILNSEYPKSSGRVGYRIFRVFWTT